MEISITKALKEAIDKENERSKYGFHKPVKENCEMYCDCYQCPDINCIGFYKS